MFDPAAVFPEVTTVRAALAARDWGAVRRVLDAATPVARTTLIRIGSEGDHLEDFLRYVVGADPNDTAAVAMLGNHLIEVGWNIRSDARAEHVSRQQFDSFHDWLRRAEVVLLDGVARRPDDPTLWAVRLISARGLGLGLAETRRRYGKLAALDPNHLPGQWQFLQGLCPKWGGSWAELQRWCRETMLAAPPGALQAGLVADGHIERWLDAGGGAQGVAYLRGDVVRAEIYEAAQRSIWHPGFSREHGWVDVASSFAFLFAMLEDQAATGAVFRLLGNVATELPWSYLAGDDPAGHIRQTREWALSGSGVTR
ncbi:hypothetical protein Ate02nite_21170 [Paractinoplanes tereljensis]|uniref:Uncharacterized protein n=1 Tax=Paractinoplanes tereljensis TaxID=571912 RepID=A0A919TST0_9ACTN|nr:hypothetical protein Ate02nite_21170 [Actinoplanes tereljensis]